MSYHIYRTRAVLLKVATGQPVAAIFELKLYIKKKTNLIKDYFIYINVIVIKEFKKLLNFQTVRARVSVGVKKRIRV